MIDFARCQVSQSINFLFNCLISSPIFVAISRQVVFTHLLFQKGFKALFSALVFSQKAKLRQRNYLRSILQRLLECDDENYSLMLSNLFGSHGICFTCKVGDTGDIEIQIINEGEEHWRDCLTESAIIKDLVLSAGGKLGLLRLILELSNSIHAVSIADTEMCMLLLEDAEESIFCGEGLSTDLRDGLHAINRFLGNCKTEQSTSLGLGLLSSMLSRITLDEPLQQFVRSEVCPTLASLRFHPNQEISDSAATMLSVLGSANPRPPRRCRNKELCKYLDNLDDKNDANRAFALKEISDVLASKSFDEIDVLDCLQRLEQQVHDPESIVSNLAIKALARLSHMYPEIAIPMLVSKYRCVSILEPSRVRIAESLAKLVQNMGMTIFGFKNVLIMALLENGVKDENSVVRKSAFSCLADCIEAIAYGAFDSLSDICDAILCSLTPLEQDWQVKNAAIYLAAAMTKKIGKTMLQRNSALIAQLYEGLQLFESQIAAEDEALAKNTETALLETQDALCQLFSEAMTGITYK
eukprot:TRINITY_DN925_c0_g1_i3.p1 TRINITY_DN925_c0_g1~~TRINITY_DN925_c0_g1_i3.p1  ORF type:complete len:526 (-),score=118.10 TRINITY_DN925_c0_g1_i3:1712-3289(-)